MLVGLDALRLLVVDTQGVVGSRDTRGWVDMLGGLDTLRLLVVDAQGVAGRRDTRG